MYRERETLEHSALDGMFLSNPSPDITGQHTQDPERFKVDKTQVLGKGSRNKPPLLPRKLSELISAGKGRSVFSDSVPLRTSTTLQGRTQELLANTK